MENKIRQFECFDSPQSVSRIGFCPGRGSRYIRLGGYSNGHFLKKKE